MPEACVTIGSGCLSPRSLPLIAHHLHCYEGKCKNLHGHTYKVVFGISGTPNEVGITVDFGDIKDCWKTDIEPYLDHRYLNETLPPMNTTAENMVVWLFEKWKNPFAESRTSNKAHEPNSFACSRRRPATLRSDGSG